MVLATIHQPSAELFEQFDDVLLLARGGKTVYFGPLGKQGRTLIDYFERNGAKKIKDKENPAEWMIAQVTEGYGGDWPAGSSYQVRDRRARPASPGLRIFAVP